MDWIKYSSSIFILVSLQFVTGLSSSSGAEGVFVSQYYYSTGTGRNLLQTPLPCSKDFKSENYTVLTSQCKAPYEPLKPCCDAFIQFACPFAEFLNNLSTDCSKTMSSYIDEKGHFPQGLFSNCKGDQNGLICPSPPPDLTAGIEVGAAPTFCPSLTQLFLFAVSFMFLIII